MNISEGSFSTRYSRRARSAPVAHADSRRTTTTTTTTTTRDENAIGGHAIIIIVTRASSARASTRTRVGGDDARGARGRRGGYV
jgi:hypothetical protein